jgi:HD-like signal output (HDOD) protein/DNA-binding NarL/FixJ family response regulator
MVDAPTFCDHDEPRPEHRALVVDDDPHVRELSARALCCEGFICDCAADGVEADELLRLFKYDVLVTDLRMPRRHGHALATDLLARRERPMIVILTGVMEPRLAHDLLLRGVDDVLFKPVDFQMFAAKVKGLFDRGQASRAAGTAAANGSLPPGGSAGAALSSISPVIAVELEGKLAQLGSVLPVSQVAIELLNMSGSEHATAKQMAAIIEGEASLAVEVLKLANSSFYNTSGRTIVELDEAVVRIGYKRIGELALASTSLDALTAGLFSWLDIALTWRRSMAAGIAAEILIPQAGLSDNDEGLFLSAIMHTLGRMVLGTLYPRKYDAMIAACEQTGEALFDLEGRVFPDTHARILSQWLARWNIPPAIHEPLKHLPDPYRTLVCLPEPLRTKVELVKVAVLIGRIAVGKWEPWATVDFPPPAVLNRLRIDSLSTVIELTKKNLEQLVRSRSPANASKPLQNHCPAAPICRRLAYCNLSGQPFDFLAEIVPSMGISLDPYGAEIVQTDENVLLNCLGLPDMLLGQGQGRWVMLADPAENNNYSRYGHCISLPCSYQALRAACWEISEELTKGARAARRSRIEIGSTC